MEVSYFW